MLIRADRGPRSRSAGSCFEVLCAGRRPFRLRTPEEARGALCTRAIVPPGMRYVVEGDDVQVVTAFVEADGILGRRVRYEMDAMACRGSTAWIDVGERLVPSDLWTHGEAGDWHTAFRRLATALDRKQRGLAWAGPRVRRAAALVESRLPDRVSWAAIAGALGVTLEQLTRMLLDEVGLPARPFARWLRLRRYARLVSAGSTVDEAARATGYRRRSGFTEDLRRLVGFTDRDVAARERWKPLADAATDDADLGRVLQPRCASPRAA